MLQHLHVSYILSTTFYSFSSSCTHTTQSSSQSQAVYKHQGTISPLFHHASGLYEDPWLCTHYEASIRDVGFDHFGGGGLIPKRQTLERKVYRHCVIIGSLSEAITARSPRL